MIIDKTGNLLDTECDVIVNTVNCVGVMGKGIALEIKKIMPENYFKQYKNDCDLGFYKPGNIYLSETLKYENEFFTKIANFTTKNHWKNPSKKEWIISGLNAFIVKYPYWNIDEIAFPMLGCGCGGLEQNEIYDIMYEKLEPLKDLKIEIWKYQK